MGLSLKPAKDSSEIETLDIHREAGLQVCPQPLEDSHAQSDGAVSAIRIDSKSSTSLPVPCVYWNYDASAFPSPFKSWCLGKSPREQSS